MHSWNHVLLNKTKGECNAKRLTPNPEICVQCNLMHGDYGFSSVGLNISQAYSISMYHAVPCLRTGKPWKFWEMHQRHWWAEIYIFVTAGWWHHDDHVCLQHLMQCRNKIDELDDRVRWEMYHLVTFIV